MDPVGQQARWLKQLAPFEFEIIHRPGIRHANADSVSRIPCKQCGNSDQEGEPDLVAPVTIEETERWTPEFLSEEQSKDPEIMEFRELLAQFPDRKPFWSELEGSSEFVNILWTMWTKFQVIENVMYRVTNNPVTQEVEECLVAPVALCDRLIRMVHEGLTGGQSGIMRTKDQVRRQAYWPGWMKSVELVVKTCEPCSRYQRGNAPRQGQLHPMLASRHFETLAIDVTGPHPKSANGFVYILTIVDHFSKFAFAYPMRNQEAHTVAKLLLDNVICLRGVPDRILTDQGPNFESQLFQELCRALGIHKIRTSPYEASTNGFTERFHLTLNAMLAKCVKENQRDWDRCLQPVLAAYRSSCHTSMSMSPNFVIFGRENVMPADIVLCNANILSDSENSVVEFVAEQ